MHSISPISGVSSSSSPSSLVGSSVIYQSGDTALLPCDVSVPKPRGNDGSGGSAKGDAAAAADELRLIMWYREDVKSPIYRDVVSTFTPQGKFPNIIQSSTSTPGSTGVYPPPRLLILEYKIESRNAVSA